MKFITGPSENITNSLIPTLLHLFPNCCSRASKCFSLLKKPIICFYIIAVFYNKIKKHLWNPHNRKSVSPEQTKSLNMYSQKGLFYTIYSTSRRKKNKKPDQKPSYLLSISEIHPTLPGGKSFHNKYQRELRGAGIPGGGRGERGAAAAVCNACGVRAAPRVSPGR